MYNKATFGIQERVLIHCIMLLFVFVLFLLLYQNVYFVFSLADHFGGKLHMGFVSIREKMVVLEVNITT